MYGYSKNIHNVRHSIYHNQTERTGEKHLQRHPASISRTTNKIFMAKHKNLYDLPDSIRAGQGENNN